MDRNHKTIVVLAAPSYDSYVICHETSQIERRYQGGSWRGTKDARPKSNCWLVNSAIHKAAVQNGLKTPLGMAASFDILGIIGHIDGYMEDIGRGHRRDIGGMYGHFITRTSQQMEFFHPFILFNISRLLTKYKNEVDSN